jgi:hypothetical protein
MRHARMRLLEPMVSPDKSQAHWQADGIQTDALTRLQQRFLKKNEASLVPGAQSLLAALQGDAHGRPYCLNHGCLTGNRLFLKSGQQVIVADTGWSFWGSGWWDAGLFLGQLRFLEALAFAGFSFAIPFMTAYLKQTEIKNSYSYLRQVYQMAGFEMIYQVLGPNPLKYVQDIYLKENYLRLALTMIHSPQSLDDYRALVQ